MKKFSQKGTVYFSVIRTLDIKYYVATTLITFFCLTQSYGQEFYVSPTGSDTSSGSISEPFATFAHAKTQVQAYKSANSSEPITVYFRGGKYYLTEPVTFTSEDSGSEDAPIIYKAYQDEVPEILGGSVLTGLSWQQVETNIYKTSVPSDLVFETLYINGNKRVMARYPNYQEGEIFNGTASDCISASKVESWADPTGGYVHALHNNMWGGNHWRITGKNGTSAVNLDGGFQNNRGGSMHGTYRYVENIFEELDHEDEWFLNRNTSELYYYPPADLDLQNAEVEVAALEQLIVLKGTEANPVKYLSFEGFTLKRTIRTFMKTDEPLLRSDWCIYRGGVVHFEGTENCSLKNCELIDLGGNAVFFNNYNKDGLISCCHIYNVGASGVCFVGSKSTTWHEQYSWDPIPLDELINRPRGPKTNDYPQNCVVDNNLIHNIGTIEKQPAGVHMSLSAYITVSRNSIYDVPRAGINVSEGKWGGHVIEYNDVFRTVLETSDHGAFNSWGRDSYYYKNYDGMNERFAEGGEDIIKLDMLDSITIRHNRFRCDHGWDIDLDDGSSLYNVHHNLCLSGGIKLRDAYMRTVENNVTVNNSLHPHAWYLNSGEVVKNNIFVDAYAPALMRTWDKELDYNLFFTEDALEQVQSYGHDTNSIIGDPMFIDPSNGDFRVAEGSPALSIGFENFPMDSFGVQCPELKAIAETPEIPEIDVTPTEILGGIEYMCGQIKNLETIEDLSATGLGEYTGAWILKAPCKGVFYAIPLEVGDVVLKMDDETVFNIEDFQNKIEGETTYSTMTLWRDQAELIIDLPDFNACTIPVELNSANWSLISTDSEVPGYLGSYAFDGNTSSFWHTEFRDGVEPAHPHEIVVDMGDSYALRSMEITPRERYTHPRIFDFELYVSSDLTNWGAPVLEGRLEDSEDVQCLKIPNENYGQYFKFVALSGNRNAAAIAEISFMGGCEGSLSIDEVKTVLSNISIYPNPVNNTATVKNAEGSTMNIYDINGRLIFSKVISSESEILNLSQLSKGIYFAEIKVANFKSIKKLVKE